MLCLSFSKRRKMIPFLGSVFFFFANIPIALQALLQKHASPPRKFIRTSHHRNTRFQSGFQACLNFLPEKDSRVQWIEARSKIVQISFLQPGIR